MPSRSSSSSCSVHAWPCVTAVRDDSGGGGSSATGRSTGTGAAASAPRSVSPTGAGDRAGQPAQGRLGHRLRRLGGLVEALERRQHHRPVGRGPERRQRALEEAGIARGHHPVVEEGDDAAVVGPPDEASGALRQPQRGVGGRDRHEAVAAHPRDGLRARRGQRVVGPRERDAVDDDELARRAGHVDALPQRERAEQAGARVAGELPHQGADLVLALAQERDVALVSANRSRIASVASLAARIDENRPSVRPPAARTSASISSSVSVARPSRPGGGQVPRHVGDALLGVGERAADVEPAPLRRALAAQADGAGDGVERPAELEGRRGEDDGALGEDLVAHEHRHAHRRDPQHGPAARVAVEPHDVELALLEDARGVLEDLVDGGPRHLAAAVGLLALLRLELALHGAGGVAHPRQRQRRASRGCRSAAPRGPARAPTRAGRRPRPWSSSSRPGGRPAWPRPGPCRGVTSSVIVEVTRSTSSWPSSTTSTSCSGSIWRPSKASMAMKEWLVTMTSTSRAASRERSTKHSDDHRAAAAQALVARHRHLAPGPLGHARHELVAVAGLGDLGPLAQPHHLGAEPRRLLVDRADRHQRVGVVVGEAALELVGAQVVAPPLDQRVGRAPAEQRGERLGQPRHVAVDDLGLQGQRRGGDDGGRARVHGVPHRGHEVGQRLAGAGAGLHEQVALAVDRVGDGVRHLDLPGPLGAADPADRGVEELVEGGHQSRVCRRPDSRRAPSTGAAYGKRRSPTARGATMGA